MNTTHLNTVENKFKNFIVDQEHPCVMANTVFQMDNYQMKVYDNMLSDEIVEPMLQDIENYIKNYNFESNNFESLIVCFTANDFKTEKEYEQALFNLLQKLHDKDDAAWDPNVSKDPNDPNFSFSIKGKAFYIVGMHPNSSRLARQAPYCTIVFNLHWQFEKLREMGGYERVKKRIRRRDEALQGSINPVLRDFGEDSETKQYSGRQVENNWKCPFHHNN
ncbi:MULTISPECIES: guanitoxin biosynthesis heme-dependent pre-guanitoxin N-hydroxylase GntA [unclassified Flavobacterium]|uniref:guanitoxin biosynthesis heme-dependent pre-guanitoxin N-hydroxylase GntA n=1 Tax=unclassified Flavobacterium TaxID=196869 RepID=UPI003F939637